MTIWPPIQKVHTEIYVLLFDRFLQKHNRNITHRRDNYLFIRASSVYFVNATNHSGCHYVLWVGYYILSASICRSRVYVSYIFSDPVCLNKTYSGGDKWVIHLFIYYNTIIGSV